jgi:rhamnogalacturonyl hydrolase YesR
MFSFKKANYTNNEQLYCPGVGDHNLRAGYENLEKVDMNEIINHALETARAQSLGMAKTLENRPGDLPYTIGPEGEVESAWLRKWVSGFFPGVLWYLYENYKTEELREAAEEYTARCEHLKTTTTNHDVGFMIFCSFGNGYRLTQNPDYPGIIETACESLCSRFSEKIGCTRSWDWGREKWNYPVIIDNMMNLEMLLWGGQHFNNDRFTEIAIRHADPTLKNHFREDASCYHVVSYTDEGPVEKKVTFQGFSDDSSWARGQGWAVYSFSMMYRLTKNKDYLDHAVRVAEFITNHPNLPDDGIPYWDFDAPNIPDALRDASAGAAICSGLLELSTYLEEPLRQKYMEVAERQIKTLCSPDYLAEPGTNQHFILKHSVGCLSENDAVDVPLIYADYYFVEALMRYKKIKGS